MTKISATGRRSVIGERQVPRGAAGFTLIELMVALVIMVLLVASMPMALNRLLPGYRFRATTENLLIELQRAHSRAQAQGQVIVVACQKSSFAIQSTDGKVNKIVSVPVSATLSCTALPGGQAMDRIAFYPDGSSVGGLLSVTDGKRKATVELSALTGRVQVIG